MSQRRGFLRRVIGIALFVSLVATSHRERSGEERRRGQSRAAEPAKAGGFELQWQPLEPLPDPVGVAGPFVGVHGGGVIVAGGANFAAADAPELWETPKRFHAAIHVLSRAADGRFSWRSGFALTRPLAYGASVSTPAGVVCVGGDDGETASSDAFLLTCMPETTAVLQAALPALPMPSTAGGAALVGRHVYVVAGLSAPGLESAGDRLWRLDVSAGVIGDATWEEMPRVPGGPRGHPLVAAQACDGEARLYVIGGRRQQPGTSGPGGIEVLADLHEFSPARFAADAATAWRRRSPPPTPLTAGTAVGMGRSHVVVLAADDGSLLPAAAADPGFQRRHPGFPRRAWSYDTVRDLWQPAGDTPACQVTTPAVAFEGGAVLVSGEIRPRVRSNAAWLIVAGPAATSRQAADGQESPR